MTLYLLFERLEAGKLKLDTQLAVSEHASDQSPTKLGLKPGQTIAVEDAIRGLVTKSANDAAVVIAEAIGGSEHDFAEMMTRKAHALGMSRTIYRNASGLPNDEQVTTARDQALLGRAIQERFPRYYRYFATPSFTYHGESMRNHNHLLGHVEGSTASRPATPRHRDSISSPRCTATTATSSSVVLGGASAGARDARMRSLIEEYIVAAAPHRTTTASRKRPATRRRRATRSERASAPRRAPQTALRAWSRTHRQARPASRRPQATYSVASYGKPVVRRRARPPSRRRRRPPSAAPAVARRSA